MFTLITDSEQLAGYIADNKAGFGLDTGYGAAFNDAVQKYSDTFFETNALVLVLLTESSGSISHDVDAVYENGELRISVDRHIPGGFMTMDMARWLAVVELSTEYVKNDISVEIIQET